MSHKLKVGIAGYGVVGKRRRYFIDQHPNMKTVAVCDIKLTNDFLEDGTKCYRNYNDLLKQDLDVLFVCLVNNIAADAVIGGLEKNLHVFCEKPPGRDLNDIAKVLVLSQKKPYLKVKYGFNHRYHDSVQDAMKLLASGELGKIINLRGVYGKSKMMSYGADSDWRTQRALAGGGILLDQGIHMVDLIRLFGGEFKEIHSFLSNQFWNHDVEDNAYVIMRDNKGLVAMLHSSATEWRHRFSLDICLEKGSILLEGILSSTKSYGSEKMTVAYADGKGIGDPREVTTRYNSDDSWRREIDEFAEAILNNKAIFHGGVSDAYRTMELVYKIYCADAEWKSKWGLESVPEIIPKSLVAKLEGSIIQA